MHYSYHKMGQKGQRKVQISNTKIILDSVRMVEGHIKNAMNGSIYPNIPKYTPLVNPKQKFFSKVHFFYCIVAACMLLRIRSSVRPLYHFLLNTVLIMNVSPMVPYLL
jgi:hypothetical protein